MMDTEMEMMCQSGKMHRMAKGKIREFDAYER